MLCRLKLRFYFPTSGGPPVHVADMIDYSSHRYSSMPQGEFESYTRRSWLRRVVRLGYRVLFWVGFSIAASLSFSSPSRRKVVRLALIFPCSG
jgi:hypothetical protein